MFKQLLVPLDGSSLSETVLPTASTLAGLLGASVTLIHVIERNAPSEIHGEHHLNSEGEACGYLERNAAKYFPPSLKVECHVHTEEVDNVARSITDHTGELDTDLVLMCSHGSGGLRDIMIGSIAQQIIGMGRTPVYLLQPGEGRVSPPPAFKKFLVALDGDPQHEHGLEIAGGLAFITGAALRLVSVIKTPDTLSGGQAEAGRLLPLTAAAMLDMTEESFLEYLEEKAQAWQQKGVPTSVEIRRGDPSQRLVESAASAADDLIILGTHGKSGMGAFWARSTAARIIDRAKTPLLLVPVKYA
jgi:nucleotide-binding universal stress UspA family protein